MFARHANDKSSILLFPTILKLFMNDKPANNSAAFVSLPLELLQARAHFIFDKHVVEVRCPSGISIMHREQALVLANNIIEACELNKN